MSCEKLRLTLPPVRHSSRRAREAIADFLQRFEVEDDLFLVAVGEALANAIEHSRSIHDIEVSARCADGCATVEVRDRGIGFSVATRDTETAPSALSERGRGLLIMHRCSDEFAIESSPRTGTTVTLSRRLATTRKHEN